MVGATFKLLPRHIAITMDGNGRWAAARGLTRSAGHRAGLTPVRMCIEECARRGVEALTLFAFSSENWSRPAEEVGSLMGLFLEALDREIAELHAKGVRVRFVGERRNLSVRLQARIAAAEEHTAGNGALRLQVAVSYGGRWDIIQATQKLARECSSGALRPEDISESHFAVQLAKWNGTHVIGTASARNQAFIQELGADESIDYTKTRFDDVVRDVDVVFDTVAGETQTRSWKVLKKGGILVSIASPPSAEDAGKNGVRQAFVFMVPNASQLTEIAKLVDSGKLKPVVETVLPLSEARRAHELSQTGHTRGKIVLRVD